MIKRNSLRIGNYVDVINRSHKVHIPFGTIKIIGQVGLLQSELYDIDKAFSLQPNPWKVDNGDLQPIPLTPELLEKAGFVKINPAWYGLNNLRVNIMGICEYKDVMINANIKYLHQIQNVYYFLEGKELTINV